MPEDPVRLRRPGAAAQRTAAHPFSNPFDDLPKVTECP